MYFAKKSTGDLVGQDYASYSENTETQPLHTSMMPWFGKYYIPDETHRSEPTASPLLATDVSSLPPAIVITAEHDPLRDQGEAYAKKLKDAGVPVFHQRYDGVTHEFFGLAGAVGKAKDALTDASRELRAIWGQDQSNAQAAR